MGHFRLHIDIPFPSSATEEQCIDASRRMIGMFANNMDVEISRFYGSVCGVEEINYRLGHDDDRQKSNYLDKNQNGHVSNKKLTIVFDQKDSEAIEKNL